MSKPKHPTVKSIRQGQTIYMVGVDFNMHPLISSFLIISQKNAVRIGEYTGTIPVNIARIGLSTFGNNDIYYSHKRAISALKRLRHE